MLEDSASVSGYVIDDLKQALAGAQVVARPLFSHSFGYPSSITDVQGRFTLSEMDVGDYVLYVRRAGVNDASPDLERVSVKVGQSLTNVRLIYDAGFSISGFVTDSYGTPIAGATIYAHSLEFSGPGKHTSSDRDGAFEIGGLQPGSHRVGGHHSEYARTELLGVPSGTNELHIVLEEAAVLEGFITLDGSPLQGVRIEVRPVNAEHRLLGTASSNEVGTFELRSLPAGEVVVRSFIVTDPGGEVYIDEQRVPLESGAVTELHLEI
ncbi:MAG: carboxypeptidase regulatory-like domain-containing protein [Candidatus Hydrogenedentes bacterium]|nr:carboxypeptidase regulatory-like domain-containing protein [Candidatus Hydrogenedentota bacterium]